VRGRGSTQGGGVEAGLPGRGEQGNGDADFVAFSRSFTAKWSVFPASRKARFVPAL
jgi:hypothetical protein